MSQHNENKLDQFKKAVNQLPVNKRKQRLSDLKEVVDEIEHGLSNGVAKKRLLETFNQVYGHSICLAQFKSMLAEIRRNVEDDNVGCTQVNHGLSKSDKEGVNTQVRGG